MFINKSAMNSQLLFNYALEYYKYYKLVWLSRLIVLLMNNIDN